MKNKEKINWLTLGTSLMAGYFIVIDLICGIQITGILFKIAFVMTAAGLIMALVYVINGSTKEYRKYYNLFLLFYCLANICFTIIYVSKHTLGSICGVLSAILLILLTFVKNIKEDRTINLAIIIGILQLLNLIFLITTHFEITSPYNYGLAFLKMGTYATPLAMSLVQIQMIRSKYIDKKSRGSD